MNTKEIALKQYEMHINSIDRYFTILVAICSLYLVGTASVVGFYHSQTLQNVSRERIYILGCLSFLGFLLCSGCAYSIPLVTAMGYSIEECVNFLKLKNQLSADILKIAILIAGLSFGLVATLLCLRTVLLFWAISFCVLGVVIIGILFSLGYMTGNIAEKPGQSPFIEE